MKKRFLILPFLFIAATVARPAQADVITYYDFNTSGYDSNNGIGKTIGGSFVKDNDVVAGSNAGSASGTTVNQVAPAAGTNYGLEVFNISYPDNNPLQGSYLQFAIDTSSAQDLTLSFAAQRVGNGFAADKLQYSTNGTTFVDYPTAPFDPGTTYAAQTFDLTSITGLNHNANAAFRIVFDGGTTNSADVNAGNYIDNIVLNGTAVATPEPSTWALMILGLGATVLIMDRRKREAADKARVKVKVQR